MAVVLPSSLPMKLWRAAEPRGKAAAAAAGADEPVRVLVTVTVLGSADPLRFIVLEDDTVATLIRAALRCYARDGRMPLLGTDPAGFVLSTAHGGSGGIGDTVGLWQDSFHQQPFSITYSNLYNFASNQNISLKNSLAATNLLDTFRLPMSRAAYNEFLQLQQVLQEFREDNATESDVWVMTWHSGLYTSRKFYSMHFADCIPPAAVSLIWKSKSMPKVKFFTWLLLVDRLNIRDVLRRRQKHPEEGYMCAMCHDQVTETAYHLFFECSSAEARWFAIGIQWNLQQDINQMIIQHQSTSAQMYFMDLFMLAAWSIWKERNNYIFNQQPPFLANWKRIFKNEVKLHILRVPEQRRSLVMNWVNGM